MTTDQNPIKLALDCEIVARPLMRPLKDYHEGPGSGPLHYTWTDKPHRLVYDLAAAVKYFAEQLQTLQSAAAQPPGDAREADGRFLLLPQRPKPEWPATEGFPHDRYSGAQMLTFGRQCADLGEAAKPCPDRYADEINHLRNVIQAACIGGTDAMIERWKQLFPDAPVPTVSAQPPGYKLLPVEPTTEMLAALSGEWHPSRHRPDRYAAMLEAASKGGA